MKRLYNRNRGYLFAVLGVALALLLFSLGLSADSPLLGAVQLFGGCVFTSLVPVWVSLQIKENKRKPLSANMAAYMKAMQENMKQAS
jgi:hypothetical protein